MKKIGILNKDISEVIASMGHMDTIVVCDAGLPIPPGVRRIDLALKEGLPGFIETVETVNKELQVDHIILAEETTNVSPQVEEKLLELFKGCKAERVPHQKLKELTRTAVAVIRTGEFTPYANVILVSGVVF